MTGMYGGRDSTMTAAVMYGGRDSTMTQSQQYSYITMQSPWLTFTMPNIRVL